ncbi:MAG TPA: amino acid permease, partial [Candidatus Thermoplasmatota archaeon]|nr:amino acid permease [Candidatus Thermoplasmatota archaeon]
VVVSTFGATNAYILASPRIYAALAQARDFPRAFGRLTRTGTPGYGLWYQAVWAGLLTMTGGYLTLADLAVFGLYTFYLLTAIAYFVLRVRHPEAFGSFGGRLRPVAPAMFAAASAAVLLLYAWNDVPAIARIRDVSDVVANTTLFGLLLIGSGLVAYAGLRRPLAGARAE